MVPVNLGALSEIHVLVVLKSNYNDKYLRYVHEEDGEMHGFVQFSGEEIVSPYTKYELEMAKSTHYGKGLVHIRCCYNNKYLVRWSPKHNWIVAGADEPMEDKYNWASTLFEPLYIDGVAQTIRFRHIHYSYYACLWRAAPPHDFGLFIGSSTLDQDLRDVYTIIDWESLLIMPKHVAFKGNNDTYLGTRLLEGRLYLHFSSSSDIGDPTVGNEVVTTSNGSVRIKSYHSGKFWKCSNHNWILADSHDSYMPSSSNVLTRFLRGRSEQRRKQKQKQKQENNSPESDMLFWPIKVDKNVVALRNLGNMIVREYIKGLFVIYKRESCSSVVDSEEFEPEALVESGVAHQKDNSVVKMGLEEAHRGWFN
ncbi:hypothetical protein HYC85_003549 [Camellia sinensis]|uniref:Agglutinin domain-containing protein n=1 Tax=Camellia sinensis TaxID=4442 RepID=A0A7J7HW66_CAMSI|nr:hypothetical protein HYC85_003549 [Camellia sinensis]